MNENNQYDLDSRLLKKVNYLENYHKGKGLFISLFFVALVAFVYWSMNFYIDEVTRGTGKVIASSRVQIIQAVDGGVLSEMFVKEGDVVKVGQTLAILDQTRLSATVGEVDARLFALRAKVIRLRAEVSDAKQLSFPFNPINKEFLEQVSVEKALFKQRRIGLNEELRTLKVAVDLAKQELGVYQKLLEGGDVSETELLRAKKALNEAEARLINRKNKFLEDARLDLAKAEDEISQSEQVLSRRMKERKDSVFVSKVEGIVKNVKVTTIGGVLRPGEEILQIVPIEDNLIVEAKVRPEDIARIRNGLDASIRFDPFDYTIFGSVLGKVVHVSADTLEEDTSRGKEIYYRVHVTPIESPVTTVTGKQLEIVPGMTTQVDIRTGNRTLANFLLKPIKKTLAESLGER